MNNKLTFIIIAAIILLLGFIGIQNRQNQTDEVITTVSDDEIVVLSTFTIIADMVGEVGGDKIQSISLTKPGAEIHGYQPTPEDLIQASKADIIFENGMNLELWTNKLKASIPDVPVVRVSENIEIQYITEDAYGGKPNLMLGCLQSKDLFM